MASEDGKKKMDKKIKEEVKKEVKKEEKKESKGSGKKGKKNFKKYIKKEIKKEEKKQGNQGPKPKFSVRVTATIGYVDGNKDHGPNLKIATFLHPSLCKGPDEDRAFGPLQAAAAQYGLWRLSKVTIRMTPLVGSSAVSGTVVRLSSNLTQTPGSTSWGGLGARKHRDFQAGRSGSFILTRQDVAGPRAGGWWVTDTNTEGAQSAGPVIEAHCLGKTSSTYQDKDWTGQLFIVELTGKWEFANYNMNPALGSLERHESEVQNVRITTDANGEIQLELPSQSAAARYMDDPTTPRAGQSESTGEVVYQIVDTAAGIASSALPPPFNWLIKGGWWFLKKVIGRQRNATSTFKVYASLADAQNNKPAVSTQKNMQGNQTTTNLQITQMNAPNLGGSVAGGSSAASGAAFPIQPSGLPPAAFQLDSPIQLVHLDNVTTNGVTTARFLSGAAVRTMNGKIFPACHFRCLTPSALLIRSGVLEGFYDLSSIKNLVEMRMESAATGTSGQMAIYAAAHSSWQLGDGAGGTWYLHALLWTAKSATEQWATPLASQATRLLTVNLPNRKYRYEYGDNINLTVSNRSIANQWFLAFFMANKPNFSQLSESGIQTIGGASFDMMSNSNASSAIGTMLQLYLRDGVNPVAFSMNTLSRRATKLEKLAEKLGFDLNTLTDTDSEYHTDVDTDDENSDNSDDDEDESPVAEEDTCSDFETVTKTDLQTTYERLRAAGFSHEEAEKMAKV